MTNTELTLATPRALSMPIAKSGDRREIIDGADNGTDTQSSIKYGFPKKMGLPLDTSGLPVTRQDMNEIINILSQLHYFMMAGGVIPWSTSERDAINGYANGAVVWHGNYQWKSLDDGNMTEPRTDSTKWIKMNDSGLEALYPVGSIYIGTMATCPLAQMFGEWKQIRGKYLLASGQLNGGAANENFSAVTDVDAGVIAGLPNIWGGFNIDGARVYDESGAFSASGDVNMESYSGRLTSKGYMGFSAQKVNLTYGRSSTVRPPAFVVNVWLRTK